MVSRKSLTASVFAGLALCVAASAQQVVQPDEITGPLGRVHYDLDAGKITKIIYPRDARARTSTQIAQRGRVNTLSNTLETGWFWSGSVIGTHGMDWFEKSVAAGTGSGHVLLSGFLFGYATYAWDPSHLPPGPGTETIIGFYEGSQGICGTGSLGQLKGFFRFPGLPGVTGCLGPGSGAGYIFTVTVADPLFCLPDGDVGVGYTFIDDRGSSTLSPPSGRSATGPILTNFGTNIPYHWTDAFDWWVGGPNSMGSCIGTYWFSGCNTADQNFGNYTVPCAGFYVALTEENSTQAAVSNFNPNGNPTFLFSTSTPRIGKTWTINHSAPGGYGLSLARFGFGIPVDTNILFGALYLNLGTLEKVKVGAAVTKNITVPCDGSLLGVTVYCQGLVLNFNPPPPNALLLLGNCLDVTLGG
jgi:hypothetical protein